MFGDNTNIVRVLILQAKGLFVPLGIPNIFQNAGLGTLSALNKAFNDRFMVLYDKVHTLSAQGNPNHAFKLYVKPKSIVTFSDGLGTTESGALYMILVSDSGAIVHPTVSAYWRNYYKDA